MLNAFPKEFMDGFRHLMWRRRIRALTQDKYRIHVANALLDHFKNVLSLPDLKTPQDMHNLLRNLRNYLTLSSPHYEKAWYANSSYLAFLPKYLFL